MIVRKWVGLLLVVMLIACSDEALLDDVHISDVAEGAVEDVCAEQQQYLADEMICAPPLTCEGQQCAAFGHAIIAQLQHVYGSLTEEESIATDEAFRIIASYHIDLQHERIETEDDVSQDEMDLHAELWFDFAWLIPEYARFDLNTFEVFESGETLAHVYMNNPEEAVGRWTLGVNEENIELASETMVTYIHEFAHLLSMRDEEIDYYADKESCTSLWIDDLCFRDDSYIKHYYDAFYATAQPDAVYYYVSEYAMTSISEDFAETFAHFVLTEQPTTTRPVDEKMMFFYHYGNLVELRADILRRAVTWLEARVALEY